MLRLLELGGPEDTGRQLPLAQEITAVKAAAEWYQKMGTREMASSQVGEMKETLTVGVGEGKLDPTGNSYCPLAYEPLAEVASSTAQWDSLFD